MGPICYLVGAGEFSRAFAPAAGDFVIAADGGYDRLRERGLRCDLLIGDMDSIFAVPTGVETIRHPVRKDETDLFLAYREGARRGYRLFCIYGGGGGREDHTLANYALLYAARLGGNDARMITDAGEATVLKDGEITLSAAGRAGKHFSLFPIGGAARGVSIRGAEYEAEDLVLTLEFPLAVSNRFGKDDVKIAVRDGALLLWIER